MGIMERDEFWAVVDGARAGIEDTRDGDYAEEVAERVGARLAELGPAAAVAFTLRYDALMAESSSWNLWGAAYQMKGGCSDDAFDYFRGWLVVQGRDTWERAIADPDTLAGLGVDPDDDYLECESMLSAGEAAFDDPDDFFAALKAARAELPAGTFTRQMRDDDWDFDDPDEVRARLPRLAAIYR
ncbi:DUF4240 domain-containing protein [Dactylosporangium matsuzakiense]|uniref:DUF4240 domain-containing protein n=1 Tax=Dactylosporangium matsuzakiense TaxID=53360 RepID=A0A9W6KNL8_9ACTN|nr:DUF4240 domain-containing protein [Dactylosporangium matsuzakiense]GLL03576.1 hypothetical protein GCM10017581_053220 [Dactylosporangium matsuzakiense]